ncbi:MAG: DUF932 domain-containing protein [Clostridia bacterium]
MENLIITPATSMTSVSNSMLDTYTSKRVYTEIQDLREKTPAVFANAPHPDMSARYGFVPTHELLGLFDELGWKVTKAGQRGGDAQYGVHNIIMENPGLKEVNVKRDVMLPQLIINNSHNGHTPLKISLGLFRLVCSNGLTVGVPGMSETMKLRHSNKLTLDTVRELSESSMDNFKMTQRYIKEMQDIELTKEQRENFALEALAQRDYYKFFAKNDKGIFVRKDDELLERYDLNELLKPLREEDSNPTLWHTFNVLQEKMVEKSFEAKTKKGGIRQVKSVEDVLRRHNFNALLWDLASNLMPESLNNEFESKFVKEEPKNTKKETIKVPSPIEDAVVIEETVTIEDAVVIEETVNTEKELNNTSNEQPTETTETVIPEAPKAPEAIQTELFEQPTETKKEVKDNAPKRGKNGRFVSKKQKDLMEKLSTEMDFDKMAEDILNNI